MIRCLRSIRLVFSVAVALAAASAGDALVEGLSNSGLFWQGRFTDGSSADLGPVSCFASLALLATLGLLVARSLALEPGRAPAVPSVLRLLPGIFALQVTMLFVMETTEQAVVYGHVLGGGLWLGGPLLASLSIHAALAIAFALTMAVVLRAGASVCAGVVRALRSQALRRGSRRVPARRDHRIIVLQRRRFARWAERGPPASVAH